MKRREFITSLAVLGCTAIVPLPKVKRPLTSRHYCEIIHDGLVDSPHLTREMMESAIKHFDRLPQPPLVFISGDQRKSIMDLLNKQKQKEIKWQK